MVGKRGHRSFCPYKNTFLMKISAWQSLRKAGCTDRTFILKSNSPVRLFTDLKRGAFILSGCRVKR
ncbi:hypothetical protein BF638R_1313 [Bacteroides fragilis 638R]|uniref:Uncharacterized protein n=6 Tax=Bacteroides fragilis TaxID=817 RepID=E1WRT9_BACF6|nr:hypothetical protein HMPREF0101_00313 [Bacteroides fragilis]CBW21858.1 hypothetical protein BF638R_1313 [Bacteroides fragilis 638R]